MANTPTELFDRLDAPFESPSRSSVERCAAAVTDAVDLVDGEVPAVAAAVARARFVLDLRPDPLAR